MKKSYAELLSRSSLKKTRFKILLIEPNWLGDVLFTTPAFNALKDIAKDCFLGCALPRRVSPLLENNPFVDEIIEFDERKDQHALFKKIFFARFLSRRRYDMAILFHRSATRTLLCYLAGIKIRAGYDYKKRSFLLTEKIVRHDKDAVHKQDYYLGVIEGLGIPIADRACQYFISQEEKKWAGCFCNRYATRPKIRIAINIRTNWVSKNWPRDFFIKLLTMVKSRFPEVIFFITGGAQDDRLNLENTPELITNVKDMCGKTTIRELAALYGEMDLVISADSGPLHLAAAVNTPHIGIYGATDPRLNSPRSKAPGLILFENSFCKLPCFAPACPKDFICMKAVTPERVASSVQTLLTEPKSLSL